MLAITPKHKIFIAVQYVDFRRGIDGIAALCRQQWQLDPFSGHFFIFRNRKANSIKGVSLRFAGAVAVSKKAFPGPLYSLASVFISGVNPDRRPTPCVALQWRPSSRSVYRLAAH